MCGGVMKDSIRKINISEKGTVLIGDEYIICPNGERSTCYVNCAWFNIIDGYGMCKNHIIGKLAVIC